MPTRTATTISAATEAAPKTKKTRVRPKRNTVKSKKRHLTILEKEAYFEKGPKPDGPYY